MPLKKRLRLLGLALFLVVCALVARRHAAPAFGWAFLLFGAACVCAAGAFRSTFAQYVGVIVLSVCLAASAGEFYLAFSQRVDAAEAGKNSLTYTEDGKPIRWAVRSEVTGYAPKSPARARGRMVRNGTVVYDVLYSINEHGRRITPEHPEAKELVAFFGCSFTFGEALNDEEGFVWKTAQALGPEYQVVNFGFCGYGPHQFLSLLESGALRELASGKQKVHVFFLSLYGHELRSGGYSEWDGKGPWYVIKDGRAVRQGTFEDRLKQGWKGSLDHFFRRSRVYTLLFYTPRKMDDNLRILQAAILREAAANVAAMPNADLTILAWPGNERIAEELAGAPAAIVPLAPVLPGYLENRTPYIIPREGHPNAYSNDLVAAAIVRLIRGKDE